ncbi:class I SAM-dependent methyltransferase [Actinomyces sp.]|uniref:class I SAM-dependent methyltransferase n=1 Tax=Actinomyces sp. TaxID=29317 RepID=UPI0028981BD7|nr:class I SAM-dependent methyltransferase [Actinomyces sp.]
MTADDVDRALADNRANWDDRAGVHVASEFYDVRGLVSDPEGITDVVRRDLAVLAPHLPGGSVRGLTLLHLQCHIGTDTLSWARLGAVDVHGLDFSERALDHARDIAGAAGEGITYVQGDAQFASEVVDRTFDVVVTSVGTICWLPELVSWAHSVHDLLVPGGVFMIRDDHRLVTAMDPELDVVTEDYLSGGGQTVYEEAGSYTDVQESVAPITHTTNHTWQHDLSEVAGALLGAGLDLVALGEHPTMDWKRFPELVECPEGWTTPPGTPRIPLTFSMVARRPD